MRGLRTDTNIDTISGLVFNAWGDRSFDAPYGVWFDGDWDKPRLDDPAIQKGPPSDYAGLMQAGPSDILSYNWNEAGNAFVMVRLHFLQMHHYLVHGLRQTIVQFQKVTLVTWHYLLKKKEGLLTQQTGSGELEWVLMHKKKMQDGTLFNT